ncbi:MAG: exosortase/archaeosortase family protein [Candidatus Nezhaarchaeota archaeon]|nr:exosortase/archaeosortase family protein [Candidatus Nezhaarchaeota archaeon]
MFGSTLTGKPRTLLKLLFPISFIACFAALYFLYPKSFEETWKGRTYYLFFIWLCLLELALNWRALDVKVSALKSKRFAALAAAASLPTAYSLASELSGLNNMLVEAFPKHYGLEIWSRFMPITVEYLVLSALSILIVSLAYGSNGLKVFGLPISLLGAVGSLFLLDNLYPFGEFTPLQALVPTTARLAACILTVMGYQAEVGGQIYNTPILTVQGDGGEVSFGVAWPCSGVDGLIVYSFTTPLILRDYVASRTVKIALFAGGAAVTYLINVLRVVSIFLLALEHGATSLEVRRFHDYYGPLYSIAWITAFQAMLIGFQLLRRARRCGCFIKKAGH